jgi:hypothetical protein
MGEVRFLVAMGSVGAVDDAERPLPARPETTPAIDPQADWGSSDALLIPPERGGD